ncbi:MAG: NAD(P)-dependent oxidoreductase [Fibrobacteria bacterium]|nr:NAD(P)-dependent oxidoreductase [Fibrobacteria bacterium]
MNILLTGGCGFIGSHLVPLLNGHRVLLLDQINIFESNSNVNFHQCDLLKGMSVDVEKKITDFKPDALVHLAWAGLPDYSLTVCKANFDMTLQLYRIFTDLCCPIIFTAGTCWEYGDLEGQVDESCIPRHRNLFASFKSSLQMIGNSMCLDSRSSFIWGRLFFVYGPGQRKTSLIPYCYQNMKKGKMPEINNPRALNDFIHVIDVCAGIAALIEAEGVSGIFNIGSGCAHSVKDVCREVAKVVGFPLAESIKKGQGESSGIWADISKITRQTGWRPKLSLAQGVQNTLSQGACI